MNEPQKTLYAEKGVFEKLRKINVSGLIQKKNGLDYIPWATALEILLREDPDANFTFGEPKKFGDTLMVFCTVTCHGKSMTGHLPVQNTNKRPTAIHNPDAFEVNTAMMRCLAKTIALHGLGLQLYVNEDLRDIDIIALMQEEKTTAKPKAAQQDTGPKKPEAEVNPFNLERAIMELRLADNMDRLKAVFGDGWKRAQSQEDREKLKKVYEDIKRAVNGGEE